MNRILKWSLIVVFLLIFVGLLIFSLVNLNTLIKGNPVPAKVEFSENIDQVNTEIENKLRHAPWQGLRFIRDERIWRFYGIAGETKQITLIQPVSLVKVYYLEADGDLSFTWVATEIHFSGRPSYSLTTQPIQEGQLIGVQLVGDYVTQNGVYWEECETEYCHLAQMIDSMIVLDDLGTGLTNGFIRYGWEPPTYPMYGFLCWQIISEDENQQNRFSVVQE